MWYIHIYYSSVLGRFVILWFFLKDLVCIVFLGQVIFVLCVLVVVVGDECTTVPPRFFAQKIWRYIKQLMILTKFLTFLPFFGLFFFWFINSRVVQVADGMVEGGVHRFSNLQTSGGFTEPTVNFTPWATVEKWTLLLAIKNSQRWDVQGWSNGDNWDVQLTKGRTNIPERPLRTWDCRMRDRLKTKFFREKAKGPTGIDYTEMNICEFSWKWKYHPQPNGCFQKWWYPQIIHFKIGFSIIFTIHFGVLLSLETPKYHPNQMFNLSFVHWFLSILHFLKPVGTWAFGWSSMEPWLCWRWRSLEELADEIEGTLLWNSLQRTNIFTTSRHCWVDDFLFHRWDMLVSWRVWKPIGSQSLFGILAGDSSKVVS